MHGRLKTKDRLARIGVSQDSLCVIYGQATKTISHLLFECQFSKTCVKEILQWLKIGIQSMELEGIW